MRIKKYALPFWALCACIALGGPAFGAVSPVVDPDAKGSINIRSLAVEDTGNYDTPATGSPAEAPDGEPLANIRYTVIRVADETTDPEKAVEITGDGAYSKTETTDEGGNASFQELAQGTYLVRQEENAGVQVKIDDFLVSVPTTNPAGTGWLYDVYVYPKYQLLGVPGVEAYVTETGIQSDSAGQLGTVHWLIVSEIPGDIGDAGVYEVRAELNGWLTHPEGGIAVYAGEDGGRTTLQPEEDYTATAAGNGIAVALTAKGKAALAELPGEEAVLYTDVETQLNIPAGDMAAALGTRIGIDAQLRYTSSLGKVYTVEPQEAAPYVYTGGIGIVQVQNGTGQPLEGSVFQLYRSEEDARRGENPVQAPGAASAWTAVTDQNGLAAFHGLAYGGKGIANDAQATPYYLVQTYAPAGFHLLHAPVEAEVSSVSHLEENKITVQGRSGFLLPATGGIGTFWFTAGGLAMVSLAAYLYLRSRRRRAPKRRPRS